MLTSSADRIVLDATLTSTSLYLAQVVFSPVQLSTDDGIYACDVTINADFNEFVLSVGLHSNNISLHATGMSIVNLHTHSLL